jgi:hypothetical protein
MKLEARLAQPELTMDDAFEIATALETSDINNVYSKLTAPIQGPARVMQKKMELSVASHLERLHEAACAFNASGIIQTRLMGLLSHSGSKPGFRMH